MERQVTLKTAIYSDNWAWNLHLEVDANAISNQMVDNPNGFQSSLITPVIDTGYRIYV
jgi:hypothetical protein